MGADPSDVDELIARWAQGSEDAGEKLLPLVYSELRRLAARYVRQERGGHTLQPTALVNEVYLRLTRDREKNFQDRAHFYAIAARAMRRILVDYARGRPSVRALELDPPAPAEHLDELVHIDE
jgi:RNA polymerase sigma factor (TIGR02999 family)